MRPAVWCSKNRPGPAPVTDARLIVAKIPIILTGESWYSWCQRELQSGSYPGRPPVIGFNIRALRAHVQSSELPRNQRQVEIQQHLALMMKEIRQGRGPILMDTLSAMAELGWHLRRA